ncbi:hypothetical protein OG512_48215 [Streptomyces sp. NBC_01378]|uniref:hypothetical protein n=1 Tax=Streptomyces sp. NBC_01378 TaxID=2903844 RepID=UPI00324E2BFD
MAEIVAPADRRTRPRARQEQVAAEFALRRRGIRHTIPEKTDSQAARLRGGSHGGRSPGLIEERYKKRNTAERAITRLKQSRTVATR